MKSKVIKIYEQGPLHVLKIEEIDITDLHDAFDLKKISENLKGPKEDAIIKSFSISSSNNIIGMTSDYEGWIISTLSKVSKCKSV